MVPVPPLALKVKLPLAPLQAALVTLDVKTTALGWVIVCTLLMLQLLASVATIVYVPAACALGLVAAVPFTV